MPLRPEFDFRWRRMYRLATDKAEHFAARSSGVSAVALAGAWARGLVSDADIDFVIVVDSKLNRNRLSSEAHEMWTDMSLRATTFVHSERDMLSIAYRRSELRPLVAVARSGIEFLKRRPVVKQKIKRLLGARQHSFQRYEILPQTLQTLVLLLDRHGFLSELLYKQGRQLEKQLCEVERLLYRPQGFVLMLEAFLRGEIAEQQVSSALRRWDVNADKYLRRAIDQFDSDDSPRLERLRQEVIGRAV